MKHFVNSQYTSIWIVEKKLLFIGKYSKWFNMAKPKDRGWIPMKCGLSLLRHVFVSSKLFIAPFEMRRHLNIYIYQMYVLSNVSLCVATCLYMLNIHICSYMYIHVGTCNCISTCTISYLQPWSQTLGASQNVAGDSGDDGNHKPSCWANHPPRGTPPSPRWVSSSPGEVSSD